MRSIATLALAIATATGCNGGSSVAAVEGASPNVRTDGRPTQPQPAAPDPTPVVVASKDLPEISAQPLEIASPPTFERRGVGPGHELLRGKNLRLGDRPVSPDRGLVATLAGPQSDARVDKQQLIDLSAARVIATFDAVHASFPVPHVFTGATSDAGESTVVLVDVDSGKTWPLWPTTVAQRRDIVIHPASGQAWLFDTKDADEGDVTAIAPWPDLTTAPPRATRPFPGQLRDRETWAQPQGRRGPAVRDAANLPIFVDVTSDDEDCAKAELVADGYRCVPYDEFALAGGWRLRLDPALSQLESRSHELGVHQRLELPEECEVSAVTLDPARMLLACRDPWQWFLWSPDGTVRIPDDLVAHIRGASDNRVLEMRPQDEDGRPTATRWLDMVERRMLVHPPVHTLTTASMDRWALYEDPAESGHLFALDFAGARAYPVELDANDCSEVSILAHEGPWIGVSCQARPGRAGTVHVMNLAAHQSWELPAVRELWLQPEASRAIGLIAKGTDSRVVSWSLESAPTR
jgi:hypothetical protein